MLIHLLALRTQEAASSVLTLDALEVEVGLHQPTPKLLLNLLAGCLTQAVPKWAAVHDREHCSSYIIFTRGSDMLYLFKNCPRFISTSAWKHIYSVLKCSYLYHLSDLAPPCGFIKILSFLLKAKYNVITSQDQLNATKYKHRLWLTTSDIYIFF